MAKAETNSTWYQTASRAQLGYVSTFHLNCAIRLCGSVALKRTRASYRLLPLRLFIYSSSNRGWYIYCIQVFCLLEWHTRSKTRTKEFNYSATCSSHVWSQDTRIHLFPDVEDQTRERYRGDSPTRRTQRIL